MTVLTDAQLAEWRALAAGPDGADLNAVIMCGRHGILAVLDEVIAARAARDALFAAGQRHMRARAVAAYDEGRTMPDGSTIMLADCGPHTMRQLIAALPIQPDPSTQPQQPDVGEEVLVEAVARALMDWQLWPGAFDKPPQYGGVDQECDLWRGFARTAISAVRSHGTTP